MVPAGRSIRARAFAGMLIVAFVAASALQCIDAAMVNAAEDACCAAMAKKCGASMAAQHQCCRTEASQPGQQIAATAPAKLQKPAVSAVVVLALIEPQALEFGVSTVTHADRGSPPTNRGVPTYLVLSTLRV